MGVVDPSFVPTLVEARRAANAVAVAGAGRVLLFGSVARGEAHRHSDIDLMVILDDLDYPRRDDLAMELQRLAGAEVGCSVDVHLTDRPEWKVRTEQVATSFENRVKKQAMLLVDKEPGDVDWDKEMVMPASDYEEAVERLGRVGDALVDIHIHLGPSEYQRLMEQSGQEMEAFVDSEQRRALACAAAHLTVATAVKCLIHLWGAPEAQPWGHDIAKLLAQLPEPHRIEIEKRLDDVGVTNLQRWEQRARYQGSVTPTVGVFNEITKAGCSVALYTADQFPPGLDVATRIRMRVSYIEHVIAEPDFFTGRDRQTRDGPGLSFPL